MSFEAGLAKLAFVAQDSGRDSPLPHGVSSGPTGYFSAKRRISSLWLRCPALPKLEWVTTETCGDKRPRIRGPPAPATVFAYTLRIDRRPEGRDRVARESGLQRARDAEPRADVRVVAPAVPRHGPHRLLPLPGHHGRHRARVLAAHVSQATRALAPDRQSRPGHDYILPNFGFEYCLRQDKLPTRNSGGSISAHCSS